MQFLLGHGDAWQYLWNFWWFKTALLELHTNPFYTSYLHWPSGISLIFQTFSLTNTVVAVPLQYIFGLVWTYNILLIAGFILTAIASYQLTHYLTRSRFAAAAGMLIITFSPFRLVQFLGHLDLVHFQWTLWYVLYLLKMRDLPPNRQAGGWRLPALFMILTAYTNSYYLFYASLFTLIFFVCFPSKKLFGNLVLVTLVSATATVPYLGPMLAAGPDFAVPGHDPVEFSTNLVAYFKPNRFAGEGAAFLGYGAMLLTLYAFYKKAALPAGRQVWLWTITGIVFSLLSLGPYLHVRHAFYPDFKLPYAWLADYIPLVAFSGIPARMNAFVYLAIGIMAAYGIRELLQRGHVSHRLVKYAIIALLVGEYAVTAHPVVSRVEVPEVYYEFQRDPEEYAIMDLSDNEAKVLYYQTIHRKPLVGGYTTRPTKSTAELYEKFLQRDPEVLKANRIKYVLTPGVDGNPEVFVVY